MAHLVACGAKIFLAVRIGGRVQLHAVGEGKRLVADVGSNTSALGERRGRQVNGVGGVVHIAWQWKWEWERKREARVSGK